MSRGASGDSRNLHELRELHYGFHPVREVLRHQPERVEKVWISAQGKRVRALLELAQQNGISVEHISGPELLRVLEDGGVPAAAVPSSVHNGCVALVREASKADSAVQGGAVGADQELIVLLEDVQDPRNLGAIFRVCEGAGVGRVLVRDRGSAPISATTIKASAGASEHIHWERFTNTAQQLESLKEQGFWCYGADAAGDAPWEIDLKGPVVICLGGESTGLRQRSRQLCDRLIGLPMRGKVSSLNVATAASAILYEALRQRLDSAR